MKIKILFTIMAMTLLSFLTSCEKDKEVMPGEAGEIELWEQEDGTIVLRTSPIPYAKSYTWFLDGQELTSTSSPVFEFSESGEYMVAGTNRFGMGKKSMPITVDASGRPVGITVETITSEDGIVTLVASADKAWGYRWIFNGKVMQRGQEKEYLPLESGRYIVQPYNASGNGESTDVEVTVGTLNLLDPRVVPDQNFRNLLISLGQNSSFYSNAEAMKVEELSFQGTGVADMTGIRFFKNLVSLKLTYCGAVKYLDLRELTRLEELDLYSTGSLEELNIEGLHAIRTLNINSSKIGLVDISGLKESLEVLNAGYEKYESLDMTQFAKLKYVNLGGNTRLKEIKLKGLQQLETLYLSGTGIKELNLAGCQNLKSLVTSFSQNLVSLTLPETAPLEELKIGRCGENWIESIDLSPYRTTLKSFFADKVGLGGEIVFDGFPLLEAVQLDENSFSKVRFKDCPMLTTVRAADNLSLNTVELVSLPALRTLYCYKTDVETLDFSSTNEIVEAILFENQKLTTVNFTGCKKLYWLSLEYTKVGPNLDISASTNLDHVNCAETNVRQIKINTAYDCSDISFSSTIPEGAKYVHEFE